MPKCTSFATLVSEVAMVQLQLPKGGAHELGLHNIVLDKSPTKELRRHSKDPTYVSFLLDLVET